MSSTTAPVARRGKTRHPVGRHIGTAVTWVWIVLSAFPFVFMVTSAFKTRTDATAIPPRWLFTPTLGSFQQA